MNTHFHTEIPLEIKEAAAKVAAWFAQRGISDWELMDIKHRWPEPERNTPDAIRKQALRLLDTMTDEQRRQYDDKAKLRLVGVFGDGIVSKPPEN